MQAHVLGSRLCHDYDLWTLGIFPGLGSIPVPLDRPVWTLLETLVDQGCLGKVPSLWFPCLLAFVGNMDPVSSSSVCSSWPIKITASGSLIPSAPDKYF